MRRVGTSELVFALVALVLCVTVPSATADPSLPTGSQDVEPLVTMEALGISTARGVRLGLSYQVAPGWHIYWANPGDSGMATSAEISPPPGWEAGPLLFPGPHIFTSEEIVSYGYAGDVVLFVDLIPSGIAALDDVSITSRWLVCKEVCEPGSTTTTISLRNLPETQATFTASMSLLPRAPQPDDRVEVLRSAAGFEVTVRGARQVTLFPTVELDLAMSGERPPFFREEIVNSEATHRMRATVSTQFAQTELQGIARLEGEKGTTYLALRIPPTPKEP